MLYVVNDLYWTEMCEGTTCRQCPFNDPNAWGCKIERWIKKQPKYEDKSRLIPIAIITFDEDKLKEICEKAISDLVIKCPNCGTEIEPKGGKES